LPDRRGKQRNSGHTAPVGPAQFLLPPSVYVPLRGWPTAVLFLQPRVVVRSSSASGFTLIETLIAIALLAGLAAGLAHVVVVAHRAVALGGADAVATRAATQKLEELRSLDWTFDPRTGRRVTDTTADLTQPAPSGRGPGLRASAATLEASLPGYADHLDASGAWIEAGAGAEPPPGAAYVRRWAVGTHASNEDLLVLQVAVVDRRVGSGEPQSAVRPHDPGVTWVATLRARR